VALTKVDSVSIALFYQKPLDNLCPMYQDCFFEVIGKLAHMLLLTKI